MASSFDSIERTVAERRLDAWARWARKNAESLGWPGTSISHRIAEQHRIGVVFDHERVPLHCPEPVAETDLAVAALPARLQRVVMANYFTHGPKEARARAAAVGVKTFETLLGSARDAVYSALRAAYHAKGLPLVE